MNHRKILFIFTLLFSILGYSTSRNNSVAGGGNKSSKTTNPGWKVSNIPSKSTPNPTSTDQNSNNPEPHPPNHNNENERQFNHFIAAIFALIALISSGFLITYLRISWKKRGTKTLLHKITSSYCFTLLTFYIAILLTFFFCRFEGWGRKSTVIIIQYFIFSLFLWFLIISIELWLYFIRFRDYKVNSKQSNCYNMTEFCILCGVAWFLPAFVQIHLAICSSKLDGFNPTTNYLCFLPNHQSQNHTDKSDLKAWVDFFAEQNICANMYRILTSLIFLVVILILAQICYKFWALTNEVDNANANTAKTSTRHPFLVYAKLFCITGVYWVFGTVLYVLLDVIKYEEVGCIAYAVMVSSYGTLLSLSLGMKNSSLYGILRAHMNRHMLCLFPDNISMPNVRIHI